MNEADELQELRDEVAELRATVAALGEQRRSSRRAVLRLAGAAAVGAVGSGLVGRPAAADQGYTPSQSTDVGDVVRQRLNGSVPGRSGFVFSTFGAPDSNVSSDPAALCGWTFDTATPHGVHGYTTVEGGVGVLGSARTKGRSTTIGVRGRGVTGVEGSGTVGVRGSGPVGVDGVSTSGYGGRFAGGTAAIALRSTDSTAPPRRTRPARRGDLEYDGNGLWFCVDSGTPGAWRELASPQTVGSLHMPFTYRAYDSRRALPDPGRLLDGEVRRVSIRDARDEETGAVRFIGLTPEGARAVLLQVTLTGLLGAGTLGIIQGDATPVDVLPQLRWTADDSVLCASVTVKLDSLARIRLVNQGAGDPQVIIDVHGFYQ
jgi:hypothetical protein